MGKSPISVATFNGKLLVSVSLPGRVSDPQEARFSWEISEEEDALMLFHMLDASHEGHIQADEFLNGCLRLDGPAKAIDLAAFMEESRKVRLQSWRWMVNGGEITLT